MKMLEQVYRSIKAYPHRERLLIRSLALGTCAWVIRPPEPIAVLDWILIGALILLLFCGSKGRPFWFLWGIVIGIILAKMLPILHCFPPR